MFCFFIAILCLLCTLWGGDVWAYAFVWAPAGIVEFLVERIIWRFIQKKSKELSPKLKEARELRDLKREVEKERLKKELAELKQQNSN